MSDNLEGGLPPADERRLAGYEELCPDCVRQVGTLRALLEILPSLGLSPATSFEIVERAAGRVRARIGERS